MSTIGFIMRSAQITKGAWFEYLKRKGVPASKLYVNKLLGYSDHLGKGNSERPMPEKNIVQFGKFSALFNDVKVALQIVAEQAEAKGQDTLVKGINYVSDHIAELVLDNQLSALKEEIFSEVGEPTKEEIKQITAELKLASKSTDNSSDDEIDVDFE